MYIKLNQHSIFYLVTNRQARQTKRQNRQTDDEINKKRNGEIYFEKRNIHSNKNNQLKNI